MTEKKSHNHAATRPMIGIEGQVVRTCGHCGAPGTWQRLRDNPDCARYPGVLSDTLTGFVGTVCPNCGADRSAPGRPIPMLRAKRGWLLTGRIEPASRLGRLLDAMRGIPRHFLKGEA